MGTQEKIYAFFGSLPGLLILAAAVIAIVVVAIIRKARVSRGVPAQAPAPPGAEDGPPRWLVAVVAAYLTLEGSPRPSAESWRPAAERIDPWIISQRRIGVYK